MKKQRCGISDAGRTFERGESPAGTQPISPAPLPTQASLSSQAVIETRELRYEKLAVFVA
jgi:hypothetical protein